MKKWIVLIVLLFPATLLANPVVFDPFSSIRLVLIIGSLLWLEAAVITIILCFCRMEIVPSFIAMFAGNLAIYFAIFLPVLSAVNNLLIAEATIVTIDGAFIKIISTFDSFQMEDFKGLKWRTAFICAIVGNALSYYVGAVIIG